MRPADLAAEFDPGRARAPDRIRVWRHQLGPAHDAFERHGSDPRCAAGHHRAVLPGNGKLHRRRAKSCAQDAIDAGRLAPALKMPKQDAA